VEIAERKIRLEVGQCICSRVVVQIFSEKRHTLDVPRLDTTGTEVWWDGVEVRDTNPKKLSS
jgi:hypothetical protein